MPHRIRFFSSSSMISNNTDDSIRSSNSSTSSFKKRKVHFQVSKFSYKDPELILPPLFISNLFYTREELEQIHLDNNAIITCLEADSYCLFSDDVNSPTRGLEDRTRIGARRRFWNQQQSLRAVLQEQERQRQEGLCEPETIAQLHSLFSQGSRREARRIGTRDACIAKMAMEEMVRHESVQTTGSSTTLFASPRYSSSLVTPPLSPLSPTFVGGCIRQLYGLDHDTASKITGPIPPIQNLRL